MLSDLSMAADRTWICNKAEAEYKSVLRMGYLARKMDKLFHARDTILNDWTEHLNSKNLMNGIAGSSAVLCAWSKGAV